MYQSHMILVSSILVILKAQATGRRQERQEQPRPRLRDDLTFEHPPVGQSSGPTVRWVTWINSEKLWEDFGRKLDRALREQGTK